MYLSEKPRPTDFYKEEDSASTPRDMIIEVSSNGDLPPPRPNHPQHHHQILLGESSSDDPELNNKSAASGATAAPKKRAETWLQDETRCLISLRHEIDNLFNTTKSNKHLWDQISSKMREKGFDRSPTMCTDKWRNLLKEFKKAKYHDRAGSGSAKMSYYKEIEEILRERSKSGPCPNGTSTKLDYMHFSDKGIDDTSISFGQVEASTRPPALNLERGLDHDGHPLAITPTDSVAGSGVPPWSWRDTPGNAGETQPYGGRVISVRWGDYTRRIGIDGSADSIKEAIRSAFRLRTKRAFWLEDQFQIVRSLDRDMPLGNYTLHLDEGLAIKVCLYDESDHIPVHTEDKVFYNEDDYRFFLARRGWTCLRELDGIRTIDCMDDLRPGAMYRGGS